MTDFSKDIHHFFRHGLPGYLFLTVLSLYLYWDKSVIETLITQKDSLVGLATLGIIVGFMAGYLLYIIAHSLFIVFLRKKHFKHIIKDKASHLESELTWRLRLENDRIIYANKKIRGDRDYEEERITFLTSRFYSACATLVGQVLLFIIFLCRLELELPFFINITLIGYMTWEARHNYLLVREYNKIVYNRRYFKEKFRH